ncbi:MarR family transcriptional regulator [Billgrantia diversa]|uniref:MarR family winged helix-turn-helix transcriptional regulator n=1 Tax=Halomonas sp. MCCC 1A13316 TaxID=2733487 RepID=UPI0018A42DB9|nr:MarR family transcriptional regulator [Halomonas sp. MCCC 1A13316]QOR37970.1 MarR family transcriptional regulator [Halomonas sp. MCCC 1A13316]
MASNPLSQANTMPGNLLRRCHQISVAIFLRQCEAHNLTQLQYVTLAALEELGPVDQITLGSHTALDRNTVAVVVKKLEERGLLIRQRSQADLRSKQVSLTEEGRRLRRSAEPAVANVQEELLFPLSENEKKTLCKLLQKLATENNHLSRVPIRKPC